MNELIIDATGTPLGRIASYAIKQALLGKNVVVVNCNEAILLGNSMMIKREYHNTKTRGGSSLKGPFFPRSPERIVKRTIRGMVRYKDGRGNEAFKRIKCFNMIPGEYESKNKESLNKKLDKKSMKLGELSKLI